MGSWWVLCRARSRAGSPGRAAAVTSAREQFEDDGAFAYGLFLCRRDSINLLAIKSERSLHALMPLTHQSLPFA